MNILILTNHLRPGGITSYCLTLCRHLKGGPHRVMVASGGGRCQSQLEALGVRHFNVPLDTSSELNPKLISAWKELARIVTDYDIHVIHAQTRVTQVISYLLSRAHPVRRVFTCHGYFKRRWFRRFFPLWGDRVIAISRPVAGHLKADWSLEPARVTLILHGTDSTSEPEHRLRFRQTARTARGISDEEIIVGAFGRLSPVKGFHDLIKAFQSVSQQEPRAHLWLVGDGPQRKELEALVQSQGLENKVRLITDTQETDEILHAFDIFCAPSIQEGFGLSILEAMARRTPVVASRVGGITDLVEHEKTGLLVAPASPHDLAEAILCLIRNAPFREKLADAGCTFVMKHFSTERMLRETLGAYESVFGRKAESNPETAAWSPR